jgi:hypothetical protein
MSHVEARGNQDNRCAARRPFNVDRLRASLAALALVTITAHVCAEPAPAPPSRPGADGSVVFGEPAAVPAKSRKSRTIFACHAAALVEFSDRPCDMAATSRSLEFTTGTGPGAVPTTRPRETVASTLPKVSVPPAQAEPVAHDDEAQKKKCATLQGQLDAVDSRMREGYGARDAARLWNRWRELKAELHTSAC